MLWIAGKCLLTHRKKVIAPARLIPQRPHYDAGVVTISNYGTIHAIDSRGEPEGIVAGQNPPLVTDPMGFHIVLVHEKHAPAIAQLIPAWVVGVVGRSDEVEVRLLDEAEVLLHSLPGKRETYFRIPLVAVDPLHLDGAAVDEVLPIVNLDFAEANINPPRFNGLTILDQLDRGVIEVGRLLRPKQRRFHLHTRCDLLDVDSKSRRRDWLVDQRPSSDDCPVWRAK